MRKQSGVYFIEMLVVITIVLILLAVTIPACSERNKRVEAEKQQEQQIVQSTIPCTLPRYKVGDIVETIMHDPTTEAESHIGIVQYIFPNVDPKNNQCVMEVIHYNAGRKLVWTYYPFELKAK